MKKNKHQILTYLIAGVWLVNGLICKMLNLVPRHEQIVAKILGSDHSRLLILLIGLAEVIMAIWIILRYKPKFNAIFQMIIIATMNMLELALAPELLLWGKLNAVFAFMFIGLIYYNEFILRKKLKSQTIK